MANHPHISSSARETVTTDLSMLINAGVSPGESARSLAKSSKSFKLKHALEQLEDAINDGRPLWQALEISGVVSTQTVVLSRLGEESGNLVQNLKLAARQERKQQSLKRKISSALLYPGIVLTLTLVVGISFTWFLLPKLSETFSQLHIKLPLISIIFIGLGQFLKINGIWAVPLTIISIFLLGYVLFLAPVTRRAGQQLLLYLPGIADLLREIETAKFGFLLGSMLESGLSVTQAISLMQDSTEIPAYHNLYKHLYQTFEDGGSFGEGFTQYKKSAGLIPVPVQQTIISGELSGSLPETLQTIGETFEERADVTVQNLETLLEPFLLIIIGAGVLTVAISILLPIYSLISGFNK